MLYPIPSQNLSFVLYLTLRTSQPEKIRVITKDPYKPYTRYSDRYIVVNGIRTIRLTFPKSPTIMSLLIYNADKSRPNAFEVIGQETKTGKLIPYRIDKLRTCNVWVDEETKDFSDFAELFSYNAGLYATSQIPYQSNSGKFKIKFVDYVTDAKTGMLINTPAKVGHDSKLITVSRNKFLQYTVPMRYLILLHEGMHVYRNPKIGKAIEDEASADKQALYVYLGKGYPAIDARTVYAQVFKGASSQQNMQRMALIEKYIQEFEKGNVSKCTNNYKK